MEILTSSQAVAARTALNLSQSKVAKDTGLNRTYLSQFESGSRILEDRWQSILHDYYQGAGWVPSAHAASSEQAPAPSNSASCLKIRDGFLISGALQDAEVESLLSDYYDNQVEIEAISASEAPKGMFNAVREDRARVPVSKLFALTCQQDTILRRLRGHNVAVEPNTMDRRTIETIGQYAGSLVTKSLELPESQVSEEHWLSEEAV